jgi:hypothetical protein
VVDYARYQDELRALEGQLRPTPRGVLPYLFKGSRRGLSDAADAADRHASALESLEPPTEAVAGHQEYVTSLRAVAHDARELAAKGSRGRRAVDDVRALPSFKRMVAARELLLDERSDA